jgi:hypothetical protein
VFSCAYCGQQGMVQGQELLHVRIPPEVPSGSIYELRLGALGVHNFNLRFHVLVGERLG